MLHPKSAPGSNTSVHPKTITVLTLNGCAALAAVIILASCGSNEKPAPRPQPPIGAAAGLLEWGIEFRQGIPEWECLVPELLGRYIRTLLGRLFLYQS